MSKTSIVYLLHFDEPYKHARHYMGSTTEANLDARLEHHRTGNGSRLMAAVSSAGISWRVVRLWIGDKNVERQLKNNVRGNTGQYCPECHERPRGNAVPEWEEKAHEK
jgi:hypothetical protein